jgi:hypothetical protein
MLFLIHPVLDLITDPRETTVTMKTAIIDIYTDLANAVHPEGCRSRDGKYRCNCWIRSCKESLDEKMDALQEILERVAV